MKELLRTNDLVKLSWLTALLADAGIEAVVLDSHTSVLEGSAFAIPRRLAVVDEDYLRACRILGEAGEELPE
jgi:Putative prokaryotic signal transducing protein